MDSQTKIHLSPFEVQLVTDAQWILTKNGVLRKVLLLLGQVQENVTEYTRLHPGLFPSDVAAISPKISRGENYRGLPWLVQDYPRYFDKENIFAIRIMFWWANHFSVTLHLSGRHKERNSAAIVKHYEELCRDGIYWCVNSEQWDHHFEQDNYLPVQEFSAEEFPLLVNKKSFLKLSSRLPLSEWDHAVELLSGEFVKTAGYLS